MSTGEDSVLICQSFTHLENGRTVALKSKSTPKVANRGVHCMYIWPMIDCEADCYEMWDRITAQIHKIRDLIWLNWMFYKRPSTHPIIGTVLGTNMFENNDRHDKLQVLEQAKTQDIGPPKTTGKKRPTKGIQFDLPDEDNKRTYLGAATNDHAINKLDIKGEITFHQEANKDKEPNTQKAGMTRSGRTTIKPPALFMNKDRAMSNTAKGFYTPNRQLCIPNKQCGIRLSEAESSYYQTMRKIGELVLVGAGLGGGFANTSKLKVLNYKEAMASKLFCKWKEAVKQEHKKRIKSHVFKTVLAQNLPKGGKVTMSTSSWAMQMKSNGLFQARMVARRYEQIDGKHYDSSSTAPVITDVTVQIILVLMIMSGGDAQILNICGACLHGHFDAGEEMYMIVPAGSEEFYPEDEYLLMKQTLYGTKEAAIQYWNESQSAFQDMKCCKADPCLYFKKWDTEEGLILWISWVDDYIITGTTKGVKTIKHEMMDRFDCFDVGEMNKYVGYKVDHDREQKQM